jgi:hypothetical protein
MKILNDEFASLCPQRQKKTFSAILPPFLPLAFPPARGYVLGR